MYWRSSPFVFSLAPRSQVFYYEYLLAGFYNELLSRCKYHNLFFHIHFTQTERFGAKTDYFSKMLEDSSSFQLHSMISYDVNAEALTKNTSNTPSEAIFGGIAKLICMP